jgi:hypothetical protein
MMTTKAKLLNKFDEEVQAWEALLAQIGEDRMDTIGVIEEWSVKDVVAHLTGWRKRTVARLQAAKRGEAEPPNLWPVDLETDDAINAWIYENNRNRPLSDILAESRQVFQNLRGAIEAFSEAELTDPKGIKGFEEQPIQAENFFGHIHEEHEADLRKWAEQK